MTLTLQVPFSKNIGLKDILFAETKSLLLDITDHEYKWTRMNTRS